MVFMDVIWCIMRVVMNSGRYFVLVVSASVKRTLGFTGNQNGGNVESLVTFVHLVHSFHSLPFPYHAHTLLARPWCGYGTKEGEWKSLGGQEISSYVFQTGVK